MCPTHKQVHEDRCDADGIQKELKGFCDIQLDLGYYLSLDGRILAPAGSGLYSGIKDGSTVYMVRRT